MYLYIFRIQWNVYDHDVLYAGYLHLYFWNKPYSEGVQCWSYFVVTVHSSYKSSSIIKPIVLYFYVSTFWRICAMPNMVVFCSSLISCFPCMLLRYFLNDYEMVPVAAIITGIAFVFTFHMHCICIVRSLYMRILSASFFITFLSPEIATSLNMCVPYSLLWIMMFFVYCWRWFCQFALVDFIIWLPCLLDLFSTDFGICSYQCFMFSYFDNIGYADMVWSIVSSNLWCSLHLLSVSVCNIFIAWNFVCNAWSCGANISLSVSAFRFPLNSQRNMSSSLISSLSMLLMYWSCINLFFHFFFKDSPSLAFVCCILTCFSSPSCDWLSSSVIYAAVLIVEFIFGWVFSWLLTIFTNLYSLLYVLRYSAVLIISA